LRARRSSLSHVSLVGHLTRLRAALKLLALSVYLVVYLWGAGVAVILEWILWDESGGFNPTYWSVWDRWMDSVYERWFGND